MFWGSIKVGQPQPLTLSRIGINLSLSFHAHFVQVEVKGAFPGRRNLSRLPVYLQARNC